MSVDPTLARLRAELIGPPRERSHVKARVLDATDWGSTDVREEIEAERARFARIYQTTPAQGYRRLTAATADAYRLPATMSNTPAPAESEGRAA
ncbi:hypothetical protein [Galactobacter valiniphilus]|uniref:hypothetical protein n=1 Tax=Galactobacter valiniphilus TaxID=2676122 RepID=UPI0037362379